MFLFFGIFLSISLISYAGTDPGFNQQVSSLYRIHNLAGMAGAYIGGGLVDIFGLGAFAWPVVSFWLAIILFWPRFKPLWWKAGGGVFLYFICLTWFSHTWSLKHLSINEVKGGGFLGGQSFKVMTNYLRTWGTLLIQIFFSLIGLQITLGFSWTSVGKKLRAKITDVWIKYQERLNRSKGYSIENQLSFWQKITERVKNIFSRKNRLYSPRSKTIFKEAEEELDTVIGLTEVISSQVPEPPLDLKENLNQDDNPYQEAQIKNIENKDNFIQIEEVEDKEKKVEVEAEVEPTLNLNQPAKKQVSNIKEKNNISKSKPKKAAPKIILPSVELLAPVPNKQKGHDENLLVTMAQKLENCFADFNIQGEVQHIVPGPVITMFEFKPAPGIKISKISGLNDDLALALKAQAVRIVAPLPRKDTVGIEIPNENRQMVFLKEVFTADNFVKSKMQIPMGLGKNIQGDPLSVDLAEMPHLLVAGATGAGKSVCLNSLIVSMLYKFKPEELKMLLVDPKRIELAVYADLPHLIHPVVTDMALTKGALDWAVHEMEQRYDAMAKLGVRNILSYNDKLKKIGENKPEELQELEVLPYLVIIIDELADLMMTGAKEVEGSIVRLAQLARAAGVHLILATQRPSVDVVTGLIKANFPSRIAFQVSSKHDSRTILDSIGAEYLLGKGDMLYKGRGGGLLRAHGAFVDDDEIQGIVNFWKSQAKPKFAADFSEWQKDSSKQTEAGGGSGGNETFDDPKYSEAVEFVMENGKASISMIQRRLRIGFNRAARFIEQMEQDGILGPQDGSKPRTVLRKD